MEFRESKTRINLMRAFAGESQARNRYMFAAKAAEEAGLHAVARMFRFTAEQEQEHAELFFRHLVQCEGESVQIDAGYPVENLAWTPERLLRSAQHNEYEEAMVVYPSFAATAKEEGLLSVSAAFELIARIEQTHGDRFGQLAARAQKQALFRSEQEIPWLCLNCGHVHIGKEAPPICPACRHAQGYFIRAESTEILAKPMV